MSVNTTNTENSNMGTEHQINTPSTTYLIAQGGGYYPLYQMAGDETQTQAQQRHCCTGALDAAKHTAKYDENDLYSLKPNVKVDFDETFQEPEGSESIAIVWKYNRAIYTYTLRGFYIFLAAILGPVLAIAWALVFASMNFFLVWCVNPTLKLVLQLMRVVEIGVRGVFRPFLDPVFQSFGQMLANVRGSFTLNVRGLEGVTKKKQEVQTLKAIRNESLA